MGEKKRFWLAALLLSVGLLQMVGDLVERHLHSGIGRGMKGIGLATQASPAPKVFSAVRGFETYSTTFYLEWSGRDGKEHSLELTPAVYGRLRGPYNRRNVYGAVLAYGPVLPEDLRTSVMRYALCGEAPLLRELGVDPSRVSGAVRVRYEPRAGTPKEFWTSIEAPCR